VEDEIKSIQNIVSDLLRITSPEDITLGSNLFDLGFDSLLILQLIEEIKNKYGIELHISEMFENPTIEGLAIAISIEKVERFK